MSRIYLTYYLFKIFNVLCNANSISETFRVKQTLQHEMHAHPIRISASNLFKTTSSEIVSSKEKKNNPHQS